MVQEQIVSSEKTKNVDNVYRDEPQLRFPEFHEEWKTLKLGDFLEFISTNSLSRSKLNLDDGKIKNIHYGDIHTKFPTILDVGKEEIPFINLEENTSKFKEEQFCKDGDLIIADASEDYADIGKAIELVNVNTDLVAGLHTILARDKSDKTAIGFKGYLFLTEDLRKKIKINANGISVLGISKNNIANLDVRIPSKHEQEKISSFLRAIDRKIELLEMKHKNYMNFKKYLMDFIFTNKPLFNNEYEIVRLGKITKISTGNKDVKDKKDDGKYPFFVRSEKIERIDSYSFDGEAILIPGDGKIGEVYHYINGKFDYHQRVYKISDFNENVNAKYIFYYLQKNFLKQALRNTAKATVDSLRLNTLTDMKIELPSIEEQIKIVDILSLVDEKINLVGKDLENTKTFKKGLLQKMFV